ncbi:MAG: hypothetical protein ACFE7R_06810 [Candidatus Hodarchaeota archaeon]
MEIDESQVNRELRAISIIAIVAVAVLATSSLVLLNRSKSLQTQVDDLQKELDSLNSKRSNYASTHLYTNSEYDEAFYSFYYMKPERRKFGVYNLENELEDLEWTESYEYRVFDCSEMSACLEWFLENRGWNVIIVSGDSPDGSSGRHAWLLVEVSQGKYMPVESTTIRIVWWEHRYFDNYWDYDMSFETIQEALDYSENGYDWWELEFSPIEN